MAHRPPVARALAVLTSFIAVLAVFAGLVTGVLALIRHQWRELAARVVAGVDQLHAFLTNGPLPVSDQEINAVRASWRDSSPAAVSALTP
ncbi:hypothetical protein AB6813_11830 [bacterium RCC_150]